MQSSPTSLAGADVIVRTDFDSMRNLEAFYRAAVESIMPDLGRIDGHGNLYLPSSLENPSRTRRCSSGSGGGNDSEEATGNQPGPENQPRSFMLGMRLIADMVANKKDVANVAEPDQFDTHDTSCLPEAIDLY